MAASSSFSRYRTRTTGKQVRLNGRGHRSTLSRTMENRDIAAVLRELAVFSELAGQNPFKARAFEAVARTVEKLPERVADLASQNRLSEVKGIGKGTGEIIRELLATGASSELAKL